jgi:hypothetical protein
MADIVMNQNDLLPLLVAQLCDANGAINLTGVTSVYFIMKAPGASSTKINAACSVSATPTDGTVTYTWAGTDTNTAGTYQAEFQIRYSSGKYLTVPNDKPLSVLIVPDLG